MQKYAPGARALGVAELADHRFVITADGYASVEPLRAQTVHGVLWRITPRDRVLLDAWENVGGGLYRAETLPVRGRAGAWRRLSISRGPVPRAGEARLHRACGRRRQGMGSATVLYPRAGSLDGGAPARAGRAQDRGIPVKLIRHVVFRGRVQGVGFRAFVEDRRRGPASRAGCATAATARSKRCSPVTPRPSTTPLRLAARALTPLVSTVSKRATAAPRNSRCAATKTSFAVLQTA